MSESEDVGPKGEMADAAYRAVLNAYCDGYRRGAAINPREMLAAEVVRDAHAVAQVYYDGLPPTDALAPDLLARLREATRETGFSDEAIITTGIDYLAHLALNTKLPGLPVAPGKHAPAATPYTLPAALGLELAELAQQVPQSIEEIVRAGMAIVRVRAGFDSTDELRRAMGEDPDLPVPGMPVPVPGEIWGRNGMSVEVLGVESGLVRYRYQSADSCFLFLFTERFRFERPAPTPPAPKLPQVGEVWERIEDGELFEIEALDADGVGYRSFRAGASLLGSGRAGFLERFRFEGVRASLRRSSPNSALAEPANPTSASADGLRASIEAAGEGSSGADTDETVAGYNVEWDAVERRRLLERIEVKALELAVAVTEKGMPRGLIQERAAAFADHLRARILGGGA